MEYSVKDAIKTAIQMEKDGYSFYKKAAAQTSSTMGQTFFKSLADDELIHLDTFQKMFEDKVGESEWNELVNSSKKYENLPVFPKDLKTSEGLDQNISELDALRIGMDNEKDAIDYYTKIREEVQDEDVKRIIDKIIEQEKNHYSLLENEFNHIQTTGYWFDLDYLGK